MLDIDLDMLSYIHKKRELDVSRTPEFLFIIISVIYAAIFALLTLFKPEGVPMDPLMINEINVPYYLVGIFAFFLILTFFTSVTVVRHFIRK